MFNTNNRVQLSQFASHDIKILRDCAFYTVGKIPTRASAKLVPLGHEKFLPELLGNLDDVAGIICTPELAHLCPAHIGCATAENPLIAAYSIHMICKGIL